MRFRTAIIASAMAILGASMTVARGGAGQGQVEFTADFNLDQCAPTFSQHLVPDGGNLYFSLEPGRFLRYEGDDEGEFVELEITVLDEVKTVVFKSNGQPILAIARVIEEREWADGELVEVSRNYFARCPGSTDIFYVGEDVDIYEDGEIVGHDGAWLAGVDGAEPGLIMPGLFLLGSRYFQEIAPDVAMDRAEHVEMGMTVETPAGEFTDCVLVVETTPLEPDEESVKIYAPGIGLIVDDVLELAEYEL